MAIYDSTYICNTIVSGLCQRVCEANYKPFVATLSTGSYFKLATSVTIWPPPLPYKDVDILGKETFRMISTNLEVCGFISESDIGSPMSVGRYLVLPRGEDEKSEEVERKQPKGSYDLEKLDVDVKAFYMRNDGNSDDESVSSSGPFGPDESLCVLLHDALKSAGMAALVILSQNWFGFLYSPYDNKKKSNLMLMVLQPGTDVIPWLGDFRLLTHPSDPVSTGSFPVKPEKKSYAQNCVSWIKPAGLQSDIQKVLRHAKKLPEKTQHFYKVNWRKSSWGNEIYCFCVFQELNRIRKATLSLGFVELLDGLAGIFEREIAGLQPTAHPEIALQLKHAATEIRKPSNRNMKHTIVPFVVKY